MSISVTRGGKLGTASRRSTVLLGVPAFLVIPAEETYSTVATRRRQLVADEAPVRAHRP